MAYVGKGSGYRMTRHLKASHNPSLSEWIDWAKETGAPIQYRKIKHGLTNREALRIEGLCYEKWQRTLCNRNNPYPELEIERLEAEWQEAADSDFGRTHQAWMDAVEKMYDGALTREEALGYGFIDEEGRVTYGDCHPYNGPFAG